MTSFSPTILHEFVGWADGNPVALDVAKPAPARLRGTFNRTFIADMSYVERVEGKPDWTAVDAWVAGNVKRGRKLIFVLCELPGWCEGRKDRWQRFEAHCWSLFARYGSDVARVAAGREFDTDGHLGYDRPDDIVRLWSVAHQVFGDRTILGSIQSLGRKGEGLQRMRAALLQFIALHGAPHAVSLHLYENEANPLGAFEQLLHEFNGMVTACGAPLAERWDTETGIWRQQGVQFADMSEKEQGAWLRANKRAHIRAFFDHVLFWHFDATDRANGGFGFLNASSGATTWNQADTAVRS